jgi:uncharacterized membrane protein YkvA (DUF1232 family)
MPSFNLIEKLHQLLAIVSHAWRDSRVPVIARICLLLAPLYWLFPFDLIADHTPGGYIDDAIIVPSLIGLALFLVPRVVYQDARRAKAQFACGLLFLSFAGIVPSGANLAMAACAKTNASQGLSTDNATAINKYAKTFVRALSSSESLPAKTNTLPIAKRHGFSLAQASNVCAETTNHGQSAPWLGDNVGKASFEYDQLPGNVKLSSPCVLSACKKQPFFIVRGGQTQLYASEGNAKQAKAAIFFYGSKMPLHLAGGIFVTNFSSDMLPSGDC